MIRVQPYYEHAGITIYHGDYREIVPQLGHGFDLVVTDPPYGVGMKYESQTDTLADALALTLTMLDLTDTERRAPVVITTVGTFATEVELYRTRPPRWRLCWRKGITSRPSPVGFTDWEPVFVYGFDVHRHAHDCFTVTPERMGAYGHPCPKPVGFFGWLIQRFSKPRDLILDPFVGSGTSLVAAKCLHRYAVGIEREEMYCEIAAKRLQQEVLPLEVTS